MEVEMETGLMPQIQALIAPPPSESPPKAKRKEREEKRRGKGQNRDTCDACGDCGNLICCDKCPTALHLQCQDPPLEEDDVPLGEWLCRVCKAKAAKPKEKKCLDSEPPLNPFDMLLKATEQQNPSRFTVGRRFNTHMPFPGAEKGPKKVITRRSSSLKKTQPEQVKLCFECSKGCRAGTLLNCDYCSLSYHMDCLDPPLTILPLGTWMCPNHPEQFLDANLLQSTSGVERADLWAKCAKEFDQEALKLEFIRKVSRKNPPFRFKVKKPERTRAAIPAAVANMYKTPVSLVPPPPNNVKFERTWRVGETPTQAEINDWLSGLFAMQASFAWDLSFKSISNTTDTEVNETPLENNTSPKNPEMVEEMMEEIFNSKTNKKSNRTVIENLCSQLESLDGSLEAQLSKMDPKLVKILAAQRLQQVLPQFKDKTSTNDRPFDTKVKIKETSPQNDVFAVFDDNLFLKNGVICAKKKYVALKDINGGLKVEEWREQKRSLSRASPEGDCEPVANLPCARAALAPIGSLHRITPVPMRYRTLTIGTSPDSDVCLTNFGSCHYTSPKHAVIFFDTMTAEYELLNYSPFGSVVDGCLYCIDSTQWRVPSAPPVADPLTQSVRAMLDKRRGFKRSSTSAAPAVHGVVGNRRVSCGCIDRVNDPTGWEGSALLRHCSHLQFGCIQFVFSVVDFAPSKILTPEEGEKKKRKTEENGDLPEMKSCSSDIEEKPDVDMKE